MLNLPFVHHHFTFGQDSEEDDLEHFLRASGLSKEQPNHAGNRMFEGVDCGIDAADYWVVIVKEE
jgi:hypothetical protein